MILFYPPTYESVVVGGPQTRFEHVQCKLLGLWAHVVPCGVEGLQHSHRQVGSIVGWGVDEQGQHDQQRQDHYDHSSIDDDNDDDDDDGNDYRNLRRGVMSLLHIYPSIIHRHTTCLVVDSDSWKPRRDWRSLRREGQMKMKSIRGQMKMKNVPGQFALFGDVFHIDNANTSELLKGLVLLVPLPSLRRNLVDADQMDGWIDGWIDR